DVAQHGVVVLAAGRDAVEHEVGDLEGGRLGALRKLARLGLEGLDLGRERLGAREQLGLLLALSLRDEPAERLLLGTLGLERGERLAAAGVEVEDRVDEVLVGTSGSLARPEGLGVVAQRSQIDHAPTLVPCRARAATISPGREGVPGVP